MNPKKKSFSFITEEQLRTYGKCPEEGCVQNKDNSSESSIHKEFSKASGIYKLSQGKYGLETDIIIDKLGFTIDQGSRGAAYITNEQFTKIMEISDMRTKFNSEKIEGGLADGKTTEDLSKMYKVNLGVVEDNLNKGIEVELEHTKDEIVATEIAMDHLMEDLDYYDKLELIEDTKEFARKRKQRITSDTYKVALAKLNARFKESGSHKDYLAQKKRLKDIENEKSKKYKTVYYSEDEMFDAPAKARANAKLALEWGDKYGRDIAMTEVGWGRAEQLANGELIPLEDVKKMSAFNRHRKNSEIAEDLKDTPWLDRGYVAWLGWGGDEGVDWAIELSKNYSHKLFTESTYTEQFRDKYGEEFDKVESKETSERDNFTDKVSQVTGIKKEILDEVYNRGIGAAKTSGTRPNVTSGDQWAKARVYSFVMKGKTYETTDSDLAKQANFSSTRSFSDTLKSIYEYMNSVNNN